MEPTQFGNEHVSDLAVHPSSRDALAVGAVDGSVHRFSGFTRQKSWLTQIANVRVCWVDDNIIAWGERQAAILGDDGGMSTFEVPQHSDLAVAGSRLLVASLSDGLISYQLNSGRPHLREKLRGPDGYKQRSLITSSRGAVALIAGGNIVYQARPDAKWQETHRSPQLIAFSSDGRRLAAVHARPDGMELAILDVTEDGVLDVEHHIPTFPVLASTIVSVEWSLDGGSVLVLGGDGELEVRNVQTTQLTFSTHVKGIVRSYPQHNVFVTGGPRGLHSFLWHHARSKLWIARRAGSSTPDKLEVVAQPRMERGDEVLLFVDDPVLRPAAIYEVANGVHTDEESEPPNPIIGIPRLKLATPSHDKIEQERDLIGRVAALSPIQDTRALGGHDTVVRLLDRLFSETSPDVHRVIDANSSPTEVNTDDVAAHVHTSRRAHASPPLHPELSRFVPILQRYSSVVPFIDLALVARLGPRAEIIAARITATSKKPPEVHDESAGWLALRTALPIDRFEHLLAGLSNAVLSIGERSFSFLIADGAHFGGFRAEGRGLGPPNRPVARVTCAGGPISGVLKEREFFKWRDHHLPVVSSFHGLENLRESLDLSQPLQGDSDHRQVHVELELPLDVRLLAFTSKAFTVSLRLVNQQVPMPLQLKLRNDATRQVTSTSFDVADDAREYTWSTRSPDGSRVSLTISDSELLLVEESFEMHEAPSVVQLSTTDTRPSAIRAVEPVDATRMPRPYAPTPTAELTGATVGPWQLIKQIGAGGFGSVYEARHVVVHHDCAVKVIHYEDDDKDAVLERLKRETRTSNEIHHPAIVPITDGGIDTGFGAVYAAMRRLTGQPLERRLGVPMAEDEAWRILRPIVEALGLCHDMGTVHRDVHPGNIFLSDSGQVHLLDFGLCAVPNRRRVTRSAMTLGHLEYAAPEQVMRLNNDAPEPTADVWSLGVVLYQVLTGRHPFLRPTAVAIAAAAERDPHQPASIFGVRAELSAVLDKCLNKNKEERFSSATELMDVLQAIFSPHASPKP